MLVVQPQATVRSQPMTAISGPPATFDTLPSYHIRFTVSLFYLQPISEQQSDIQSHVILYK